MQKYKKANNDLPLLIFMRRSMKKLFVFALFLFAFRSAGVAQAFVRIDTVQVIDSVLPLKNPWAGGLNYPTFWPIDLNGDNIMDLVVYEPGLMPGHYRLMPFLNAGDSGQVAYTYAPKYISTFPDIYAWLVMYDYNCDGKNDLFCLSKDCSCGIAVFRNDYSPGTGLKFTPVLNKNGQDYLLQPASFGETNIPANSVSIPVLQDVDNDGDMDVVGWGGNCPTMLSYFKGLAVENGWSCDSLRFQQVSDNWGHFALNPGTNAATFGTTCRMAEGGSLNWDTGITRHDDTISCICLYDQDGDGDKDALVGGNNDKNVLYLHNGGVLNDSMDYQDIHWPVYTVGDSLVSFPCAYHLDVDNDEKKDMIISPHSVNDFRGIQYFKNTDIALDTPIFIKQPQTFLQEEMIDVGTISAPQVFDYDCDGLPDLLIGNNFCHVPLAVDSPGINQKGIVLYKNIGTAKVPKFKLMTRDFAGLNGLNGLTGPFASTFGDIDGDGDPDMIVGSSDGRLYLFTNTAGSCSPANFLPPFGSYMSIDVGQFSVPQLYDLDHDGKLDLIVGNQAGVIKYFHNSGTATVPAFSSAATNDTLGGIVTRVPGYTSGQASPVFYNDSGIEKLAVGTYGGRLYIYDNTGTTGNYHLADVLIDGEEGQNLIPAIGDINNDGHPDMFIGNTSGGMSLFMNGFMIGVNELHKTVLPSFDAYPNPVQDELHLAFYHLEKMHAHFEILNSIGQTVYSTAINENKLIVSLREFTNGIYLARFESAGNAQSIKIIVRH